MKKPGKTSSGRIPFILAGSIQPPLTSCLSGYHAKDFIPANCRDTIYAHVKLPDDAQAELA